MFKSRESGITLVALIITIVVLLILASVTLKGLSGNGILNNSKKAKNQVEILSIKDKVKQEKLKGKNITGKPSWIGIEGYDDIIFIQNGELLYVGNDPDMTNYLAKMDIRHEEKEFITRTSTDKVIWILDETGYDEIKDNTDILYTEKEVLVTLPIYRSWVNGTVASDYGEDLNTILTTNLRIEARNATAYVIGDINLKGSSTNQWEPIGNNSSVSKRFLGIFDGQNNTIKGIYIDKYDAHINSQGLFGYSYGTIKNVKISNSTVKAYQYVGGIVGNVGGGTIENCYNNATVYGYWGIGGIIGNVSSNGINIKNCHNTGDITGVYYGTGGICGTVLNDLIESCSNKGNIHGGSSLMGGIVGYSTSCQIYKCFNVGDIKATTMKTGGIIGLGDNVIIKYCYNMGNVGDTYQRYKGGICGYGGKTIEYCYNVGNRISGIPTYSGGITGEISDTENHIRNCYSLKDENITSLVGVNFEILIGSGYGVGETAETKIDSDFKTSQEMKTSEFITSITDTEETETIWKPDTNGINGGYPILAWQ